MHFAFDVGLNFNQKVAGIQCTTFGSPRVGNYSFVKRYERIVSVVFVVYRVERERLDALKIS